MRCISGDSYLKDLDPAVYMDLEDSLDTNFAWRELIYHMTLPSNQTRQLLDVINRYKGIEGQFPGRILLQRLDSKMIPISRLIEWLESAKLMRPLLLLKPDEPLEIIEEPPPSMNVYEGYPLVLTFKARSFPPPEFQWFKDDEELLLQQENELVIQNASLADSGSYYCRVRVFHSRCPSESFTRSCLVAVIPLFNERISKNEKKAVVESIPEEGECNTNIKEILPSLSENFADSVSIGECDIEITRHPVSHENVRQGSIVILKCKAKSSYPLKYQWYCDGLPMRGETNSELRLENLFSDPHRKVIKWKYNCNVENKWHHRFTDCATVQLRASDELTCYEPEEKIALLIANEFCGDSELEDENFSLISNDVTTMCELLRGLKFKTISLKNLNKEEMKIAIDEFCETLGPNKYGCVYVAGHGLQLGKQTYLMPCDCATEFKGLNSRQISEMTICTDCILDSMQKREPALIVQMFDVCRNTPIGAEELVPEKCCQAKEKGNTIRCYATSSFCAAYEGDRESNGYFVKHLKRHLDPKKPKEQLEDIFKSVRVAFKHDPNIHASQCPIVEDSLNEYRTLGDELKDGVSNSIFDQELSWADSKSSIFETKVFTIEGLSNCEESENFPLVMLEFHHHREVFCNSMDVSVLIDFPDDADLDVMRQLDIQLDFVGLRSIVRKCDYSCMADNILLFSKIEVPNIQRVNDIIRGKITVTLQSTGHVVVDEFFDIGLHPVSKWQRKGIGKEKDQSCMKKIC